MHSLNAERRTSLWHLYVESVPIKCQHVRSLSYPILEMRRAQSRLCICNVRRQMIEDKLMMEQAGRTLFCFNVWIHVSADDIGLPSFISGSMVLSKRPGTFYEDLILRLCLSSVPPSQFPAPGGPGRQGDKENIVWAFPSTQGFIHFGIG